MSAQQRLFSPVLAEIIDEAYERIGMDPARLVDRHLAAARRSMNLMLSSWTAAGIMIQATEVIEVELEHGQTRLALPEGAYDVVDATLRRDGVDVSMFPITREDYENLPSKDDLGLPDRYFADRTQTPPVLYIWQRPSQSHDVMRFWYFRQPNEVGASSSKPKMPPYYFDAFAAGLAYRLAMKYNQRLIEPMHQVADKALREAMRRDSSRADLRMPNRYTRRR